MVYGLVYKLTSEDEKRLDSFEGNNYAKKTMSVELHRDGVKKPMDTFVYVDMEDITESQPKTEYIYRMNMAITDGIENGIPVEYFDKYLRPFIPHINKN